MTPTKSNGIAIHLLRIKVFEAFTLDSKNVKEIAEEVRASAQALNESDRKIFFKNLNEQIKDPDTYATLNFFVIAGLHHFYLKKYIRGSINLSLFLLALVTFFTIEDDQWLGGIGVLIVVFIVLIEIPALFRSQIIVENYNNNLSQKILLAISMTDGFRDH
jgi:TM2 domain-containing membrane protein YozV